MVIVSAAFLLQYRSEDLRDLAELREPYFLRHEIIDGRFCFPNGISMSKASCLRALRFVAPRVGSNTLTRWQLIRAAFSTQQWSIPVRQAQTSQSGSGLESAVPFRKQLKDEKNQQTLWKRVQGHEPKKEASSAKREAQSNRERWDLTVGIEVHAQLNTDRKLFSSNQEGSHG